FELRFIAESAAAANSEAILDRLETARQRLLTALRLGCEPAERVSVYLVETLPDAAPPSVNREILIGNGILAVYRADAPAPGLERALAALLLRGENERPTRAGLLVDGPRE